MTCPACGSDALLPLIFGFLGNEEGPGIRVGCYMTDDTHECTECLMRFEANAPFVLTISRRAGQASRQLNRTIDARLRSASSASS